MNRRAFLIGALAVATAGLASVMLEAQRGPNPCAPGGREGGGRRGEGGGRGRGEGGGRGPREGGRGEGGGRGRGEGGRGRGDGGRGRGDGGRGRGQGGPRAGGPRGGQIPPCDPPAPAAN